MELNFKVVTVISDMDVHAIAVNADVFKHQQSHLETDFTNFATNNDSLLIRLYITSLQYFCNEPFSSCFFSAQCGSIGAWFSQPPSGRCEPRKRKGRDRIKRRRRTQNTVNFNRHNILLFLFLRTGRGYEELVIYNNTTNILSKMFSKFIR